MINRLHRSVRVVGSLAALILSSGAAIAQSHGGGGHFSGGGHAAVTHGGYGYGGGYHGGYGYGGGYRGGYGYGGYHGGYGYGGWRGGYNGWGWGLGGLGLGLYVASLPLYYSTYWWGGIPYYYANDVYYRYDDNARQYLTVAPPPEAPGARAGADPVGTDLIAYPKSGQSAEQQAKDKYECHHWAATQTGFDPTLGAAAAPSAAKRGDYLRAQAACLDGRGYSVK